MNDRGAAALAERLLATQADSWEKYLSTSPREDAELLLGESGVYLPDGLPAESRLRAALVAAHRPHRPDCAQDRFPGSFDQPPDPCTCGLEELLALDPLPHREDGRPCGCDGCMELQAEDSGVNWWRLPKAERERLRRNSSGDDRLAATPEPDGLDVDGLCGECGHDENEHVHYCSNDEQAGSCGCNAEYARLSKEPTE